MKKNTKTHTSGGMNHQFLGQNSNISPPTWISIKYKVIFFRYWGEVVWYNLTKPRKVKCPKIFQYDGYASVTYLCFGNLSLQIFVFETN